MTISRLKDKTMSSTLTSPFDIDLGAMIPIATVTVGSGGSSSISFTSIPSTYTHLQLRLLTRSNRSSVYDSSKLRFNSDTGTNYSWHYLYGDGSAVTADSGSTTDFIPILETVGDTATANIFGVGVIDILDYANTNKYKTVRNLSGDDRNGAGSVGISSGNWRSTSAITTVTIIPYTGTAWKQYTTIALYGIKEAGA